MPATTNGYETARHRTEVTTEEDPEPLYDDVGAGVAGEGVAPGAMVE